ncbi:50S ribosomal protein L11 methyltransferase [Sphingomonas baiyangensis]|uniref:Ribosomal protein L11 methyltransferase n=1 Tax=Sphingomonas baiyangensis TaxID=2572576 RepID=A0A4U1L9U7_9SPHN|nr:50S ribosomal protein L11 methyltransferase [Sphingomonas baiyangensis]TKD53106.1 50S ribosomal protein L11 methyltransferase [Sphingomonas baiyangensis]
MSDSWKITLPCTRAEAEAIDPEGPAFAAMTAPPVLLTRELTEDDVEDWVLDAYFQDKPGRTEIALLRALVPSAGGVKVKPERIAEQDWVTLSQAGLEPVQAGRFYVHTSANRGDPPAGARAFHIEAGLAFGTGHHETTTGCLLTLEAMRARGMQVRNLIDVGTGTGLLAFAAMHLWPRARATASDIDPISIDVTRANAAANGVRLGAGPGRLALAVAPGMAHADIERRAPYDLVLANIIAAPLIELAPVIAAATAPGGTVVLAGLLERQAAAVAQAYRRHGFRIAGRVTLGDWPTLRMVRRPIR